MTTSGSQAIGINGETIDGDGVDIGKKHKLGHLRVDPQGNATFKRLPTNQLVEALQLGIQYTVGGLETTPAIDVLYQDFGKIEIVHFPKEGHSAPKPTPAHRFSDFVFRSYAPVPFRHFREKFNIRPEDFLSSICRPLRELKNPGASGSLFYLTTDDQFILKTVQKKEASFLKSLLPGYYMNLIQNPRTLLPKFFGLYCYQGENKNIRITVMNNLIPSHVQMHEKYDLKGSTYKRRASQQERQKESPTWKDLDFMQRHPNGLLLDAQTFTALSSTVARDCRVLESFQIMDYSFLIGVHQVDTLSESTGFRSNSNGTSSEATSATNPPKRILYSTPMDNIQAQFDEHNKPDDHLAQTGGIPARDGNGQRLSLYVGIIDILQSYQLRKKLEHTLKSVVTDGDQISVTHPSFYSERFQKFLFTTVFKKASIARESSIKRTDRTSRPNPIDDNERTPTLDLTSPTSSYNGSIPRIPSSAYQKTSTASVRTTDSRISSYYSSLRSTRESDQTSSHSNATTVYASSQQSDSLYHSPNKDKPGRLMTTSFNSDQARLKFYRGEMNNSTGKEATDSTNRISATSPPSRLINKSDQSTRL